MGVGSSVNRFFVKIGTPCPFYPFRAHGFSIQSVSSSAEQLVTVEGPETCCHLFIPAPPQLDEPLKNSLKSYFQNEPYILHYHILNPEGKSCIRRGSELHYLVSVDRSPDSFNPNPDESSS